ncbi:hypothetical protein BVC80_157g139 [Macleaya cordata]|uniref:Uncharacterized protein n=1 Tax=Macleaya cordata TaxID=56857 RepID=A0A200RCC7_MACCD|nr:hypothetical protein BVC80_157g139 [Macleaya cordata]
MSASKVLLSRLSSRCSSSLILKLHKKELSSGTPPLKSSLSQSPISDNVKRISRISRLPLELSSLESMMPLHSAIASARLKSILSAESQSWGMIPQGFDENFSIAFSYLITPFLNLDNICC